MWENGAQRGKTKQIHGLTVNKQLILWKKHYVATSGKCSFTFIYAGETFIKLTNKPPKQIQILSLKEEVHLLFF